MKKLFFVIFGLLLLSVAKSQTRFEITAMPLSLVDITHPSLRLGFEYGNGKFFYGLDLAYGNKPNLFLSPVAKDRLEYEFWQFRPSVSYAFYRTEKVIYYAEAESFYMRELSLFENEIAITDAGMVMFDKANYNSQKLGFNINAGIKGDVWKRIMLETYAGIGFFSRNAYIYNVERGKIITPVDITFAVPAYYMISPDFTFGIKIGYYKDKRVLEFE